jgi:hypothetical protein
MTSAIWIGNIGGCYTGTTSKIPEMLIQEGVRKVLPITSYGVRRTSP